MFSVRSFLLGFALLARPFGASADATDALARYNARLEEISRSFKEQFVLLRKDRTRVASDKGAVLAFDEKIKELGRTRTKAIAEAKLMYDAERKEQKPAPTPIRRSREQQQSEALAARRQFFAEGQKGFWDGVAQQEPRILALRAERLRNFEEQQTAFLLGLTTKAEQDAEFWAARRNTFAAAQNDFWAQVFAQP